MFVLKNILLTGSFAFAALTFCAAHPNVSDADLIGILNGTVMPPGAKLVSASDARAEARLRGSIVRTLDWQSVETLFAPEIFDTRGNAVPKRFDPISNTFRPDYQGELLHRQGGCVFRYSEVLSYPRRVVWRRVNYRMFWRKK